MSGFNETVAVAEAGAHTWTAEIAESWSQGRAIFGGAITGIALRALDRLVPEGRALRSVLVDFTGPAEPGAFRIDARVLRSGGSLSQAEARVFQGDRVVAVMLAAYGAPRRTGVAWPARKRGDVPALDGLMAFPYIPGVTPSFTQHFDYRWATERLPFTGADRPDVDGFVRPAGGDASVDAAMLLALVDAWPAPVLSLFRGVAPASTVTWMVNIVGPLDGAPPTDGFWWFEGRTNASAGGYADVEGCIFDPLGRLVATSKQLVAEFSKPD
ncbi:MAG: thioesterase family protein [Myxococcota bacterium]|nr:thioesterase family protein [Myxococcota bacterium]